MRKVLMFVFAMCLSLFAVGAMAQTATTGAIEGTVLDPNGAVVPNATVTDEVEDTIDYADVCQQVALAASERSFKTLEALCSYVADWLISRYGASAVSVRAAKPEPPIPLPVEEVAVEVWKEGRPD